MKKSGFLMLLLVCLLIAMPVAAGVYEVPQVLSEIKTTVQEEVTAVGLGCEIVAAFAVVPIKAAEPCIMMMANSCGTERTTNYFNSDGTGKYFTDQQAGRNQLYAGYV